MEYGTHVLGYVSLAEFVLLAVVTSVQWERRRTHFGWAALAFSILGGISLVTTVDPTLLTSETAVKTLVALLALVPYCLFRFATSLREASRVVDLVAIALTAGVITATFALQHLPVPGFPFLPAPVRAFLPPHFLVYGIAFVALSVFLSAFVVTGFFRAGRGLPRVAASRMRLAAVAVAGLGTGIVVSVLGVSVFGVDEGRTTLAGQALMVAAGALFLVALLPPFVRAYLNRGQDPAFGRAVSELVAAADPVDLADRLLPRVGALVGASTVALLKSNGAVVARYPATRPEDESWDLRAAEAGDPRRVLLRTNSGTGHELAALVDPYLRCFGTDELRELNQLARLAGMAMERCQKAEHMAFRASHDGLTGLANRALFVEQLHDALRHVGRRRRALAVMFIDLDRFKRVNDEGDHAAGDVVLGAVANRLTAITRGVDLVARFGGDEFAAFAEVDHERDAVDMAERIRTGLAARIATGGSQVTITASIGVVVTADGTTTPAALLREADHAMYDAKLSGRDRVVLHRADVLRVVA